MIDLAPYAGEITHPHERVPLGSLFADRLTLADATDLIVKRVHSGLGGYVVTPNVDHVCVAGEDPAFRVAHRSAYLSLVDGTPLVWLAKLCGAPLPEKISGSDLIVPICERAAQEGLRVAMFGASESASRQAQRELQRIIPDLQIVSRRCPMYSPMPRSGKEETILQREIRALKAAKPDIIFVAMGTPKQELFLHEFGVELAPSMLFGIGAGFDFIAGEKVRAPKWTQKLGLEWVIRLAQEPGRMWRRYLVRDRAIFRIAAQQIFRMRWPGRAGSA
jgi:N-acetylglucosaminyldiphosphoundecaprenol N-acetyl-beta-D-mannosaminyltransferase